MGRTKELLETLHNETTEEFINNKFFYKIDDLSKS